MTRQRIRYAVLALIGIAIVAFVLLGADLRMLNYGAVPRSTPVPGSGQEAGAWVECKRLVTDRLKAPTTAEFPRYESQRVRHLAPAYPGRYTVTSYVDAQNSFGAMIRTTYECTLTYQGGVWTLDRISIE